MRAKVTAAIDRRLASLLRTRARRDSVLVRLLPERWLEPVLAPRIRRLRIKLTLAALGLSVLLAGAVLYLAVIGG